MYLQFLNVASAMLMKSSGMKSQKEKNLSDGYSWGDE